MDKFKIFWLSIGILLLIAEILVPGFILFFFGAAALIILAALIIFPPLTDVFWLQLLLWISLSVVLLYFFRSRFSGTFQGRQFRSELEDFVGHEAELIASISKDEPGRIKYRGTTWKAISKDGTEINAGERVILLSKDDEESMTFIVKRK